ncbi:MAG: hypothetical protein L3J81_04790 [Thermoplasmata archaeon]|jgi:hypothetical protein|nr:hypothetical protein [Thermoplasmata archaeon]
MAGALPWQTTPPPPPTFDATELLRRIEQNTANTLYWVRWMTIAVIVLVLVMVFLFV